MKRVRLFVGASVVALGVTAFAGIGGADARGCQEVGLETAGVAQAEQGVGSLVNELAQSAPGALAQLVEDEMAAFCD